MRGLDLGSSLPLEALSVHFCSFMDMALEMSAKLFDFGQVLIHDELPFILLHTHTAHSQ